MHCVVDEAGKGAVLGPMVVAAVGCGSPDDFAGLRVRDSKKLSPSKREKLFGQIEGRFPIATRIIGAADIDRMRRVMTMNSLVAMLHAEVINYLGAETAYVDACDVNAWRYGRTVQSRLDRRCRVVSEHHADEHFPVVSAASIIAKVTRDREVARLAEEYGVIGTGYPTDPETIAYLTSYINLHRHPPPIARESWKTVGHLISLREQSHISDF